MFGTTSKILREIPQKEHPELMRLFKYQKSILEKYFPRGRFQMAEDGRCVLISRNKRFKEDHIWLYGTCKLGFYTDKNYEYWYKTLNQWIIGSPIPCADGEGVIYLKADPTLSTPLKAFMLKLPNNPSGSNFKKPKESPCDAP